MAKVEFNYKLFEDARFRATALDSAKQIHAILKRTGQTIIEIGNRLSEMKDAMDKAIFWEWVQIEFDWQRPTVFNYMQAAKVFGGHEHLERFQPKAIIDLARRNTPQTIIDAAFQRAASGQVVSHKWVWEQLHATVVIKRADANQPRSSVEVSGKKAPTIQSIRFVLTEWKKSLPATVKELSGADFQELEEGIEDLLTQLRAAKVRQERPKARSRRGLAVA